MGNQGDGRSLSSAFDYAFELHADQRRKQSPEEEALAGVGRRAAIPYIAHLMSVAALVLEHGGSEEEAIAALLHDGPEDQGGEPILEEIRRRFGSKVAEIVSACSDTFEQPKPEWVERKQTYLDHLGRSSSDSLLLVSLSDKVHNLRSIEADYRTLGEIVWTRFNQGRDGTLWYYTELRRIYRTKSSERCEPLRREYEAVLDDLIDRVCRREGVSVEQWADCPRSRSG